MENNFSIYKIKDLAIVKRGASPRPINEYIVKNGYPWLKISDFSLNDRVVYYTHEFLKPEGLKNTRYVKKGTLICTNSATPGIPIFLGKDMCLHDGFLYFEKLSPKLNANYLYYFIIANRNKLIGLGNGSVFVNLKKEIMENYEIALPPLHLQNKITSILESIDDKIELNNIMNSKIEEMASSIYKNLFIDISKFNGKVPTNWKYGTLGELAQISSGKRPNMRKENREYDCLYPLIGAASIMGFTNDYNLDENVLITGRVGTHGVIQRFSDKIWASDNTLVIKTKYYEYVYQFLKRVDYSSMNRGSTQPLITQKDLSKKEIIIPDQETLNYFENTVSIYMDKIRQNNEENKKLSELRDALLPKLMSGEINVEDIKL